ncbi:MAG: diphthine synthase, partial [archaeon]|nr:diphthine synthase [archaeon]
MLYLIGLGLIPSHLTLEAQAALRACKKIYLEVYTSQYAQGSPADLEKITGKQIFELTRKQVEEELAPLLEEAKSKDIGLAVFGNPLNATTHIQILLDAKKLGAKTIVVAGIGVFEFVSLSGLDRYKFGRTTTLVFHEQDYEPESFYDAIIANKKMGLHTLCLLDIKKDEER